MFTKIDRCLLHIDLCLLHID